MSDSIEYDYTNKITSHKDLGVKKNGKYNTIKKNVKAIDSYIDALQIGNTPANKESSALGNVYFHNLGIKCKNQVSNEEEDLYTYYDNMPKQDGVDGLIPGIKDQINSIKQDKLYNYIENADDDEDEIMCRKILCPVRDDNHKISQIIRNVSIDEHAELIAGNTELLKSNLSCKDGEGSDIEPFSNLKKAYTKSLLGHSKLPSDNMITTYYTLLSILGLYFIYNCSINKK